MLKKLSNPNASNTTDNQKSGWKRVKNAVLTTAVAATLLTGSGCKKAADHPVSPKGDNTERVDSNKSKENSRGTKRNKLIIYTDYRSIKHFSVEKDSVGDYIITTIVNDKLKTMKAPTNDIIGFGDFDGTFYYSCVVEGEDGQLKAIVMNENGDTIDYGLDYITDFVLNKGNVGMTGYKDNEACYVYNGKIIDKGCDEYHIHHGRNRIYVHSENFISDDKQEHCEIETDVFVDGEKTPYSHTFEELEEGGVSADLFIQDYGNSYYILYWGKKLVNSTINYKGKLIENVDANNIITELDANNKIAKLRYKKNDGKRYLLTKDGEEKELAL